MTVLRCPSHLACVLAPAMSAALVFGMTMRLNAQETAPAAAGSPVHLTLSAAVDIAVTHNHKLELARLAVQDSEQQKRVAESHFYPIIKNESAVLHVTELEGVLIPHGSLSHGAPTGPIPPSSIRIDQGAATTYTSGTGLEQPLTQMFKIHAGVKATNADLQAAKIQAGETEDAIALAVHQLYYNYLIEQMNKATAEEARKASQLAEEENQKGVQEGWLLTGMELESRADLLDKQRAILISKMNLDNLTLQLDDILGLPLGTRLELDPDALGDRPVLPSRTEAIEEVLQKSPTVLAARQSVEKAKAGLSAARDAYIPNITGIARYSYQSGLPFLAHNFGTFGAAFSYDLFDGREREANLQDARIKLSMARTQLAQAENDVRIQISAAYDRVEELQELLKVSELTLETRQENYRVQGQLVQVNAELESGVAKTRAAATAAKLNVLKSRLSLYMAEDDIERQLGEMPR
jgi:outer membrane protein TolC